MLLHTSCEVLRQSQEGVIREVEVREIKDGGLFESFGIRYRKIHSNECRAYVRPLTTRHVKLKDGTEFDSTNGCINISPGALVTPIEGEDLI